MRRNTVIFLALIPMMLFIGLFGHPVHAASTSSSSLIKPTLAIDIPTVTFSDGEIDGDTIKINYLGDYIAGVYKWLLGSATLIAIVMLMIGGLQYTIFQEDKAKTRIKNAVTGLVLLLSTYLILATINPQLVIFKPLSIQNIPEVPLENLEVEFSSDTTTSTCTGSDCVGVSHYQDCMIEQYGGSPGAVRAQLVPVTVDYAGHTGTYYVHQKVQAKFQAVFDAIAASGTTYDITKSIGIFNWRAVTAKPKYLSNHSWATGIDINPDTNPYCSAECFDSDASTKCFCVGANCQTDCPAGKYDLPKKEVIDIFISNGFDWLGDRAEGKFQDYMHFDAHTGCE